MEDKPLSGRIINVNAAGRQEFRVTFSAGGIDFAMNGDLAVIIQMLYQAAEDYPQAAKTLITTVLIFADKKGIPLDQLKKHSFIEDQKIITPWQA